MLEANSTGGGNFFAANTIAAAIADTHPHLGIMIDGCQCHAPSSRRCPLWAW